MEKIINVENLSYSYKEMQALKDVSFSVDKGAVCGLFGPNGSGKTTLFKCMSALLQFDTGRITVGGLDVSSSRQAKIARTIAYVPQEHKISFPFTVLEVVLMGRTPYLTSVFGPSRDDLLMAEKVLDEVGITHLASRPCNTLSGGQRQLVYIARAIAQDTPVIFLDEPTSALDFDNQILVWKIMKKVADTGVTVVVCSHDPNHIMWYTSQVVVLLNGEIAADGHPDKVFNTTLLERIYQNRCSIENSLIKPVI